MSRLVLQGREPRPHKPMQADSRAMVDGRR